MDFKLEFQTQSVKNHCAIIIFMCDTKKTSFMGSYCAEAQKTRLHDAMRKSALLGIYYVPLSDHLSEDNRKPSVRL